MDTFSDLWIQYEDGSWRWVSLIGLLERRPYHRLARPEVFRVGTLSVDRRWIEWSTRLRLPVDHFGSPVGELTPQGVVVRAASDAAFGWFRPLWVWHPRKVQRQRLVGLPGPRHQSDVHVQTLQWLGWSEAELEASFRAYKAGAEAVAARLLDLILSLGGTSPTEASAFRRWLDQPWSVPGHATPRQAIETGDIALIERLYATTPAQR
jgi:hypothetical protein